MSDQVDLFGNPVIEEKQVNRDLLLKAFISNLKGIKEEELVSILYSKYEAIIDFYELCNNKPKGHKISMLFNPHRYNTPTVNSISIIEAFNKDNFLSGLARATLFKKSKVNSKELLYQVLQLGINGVQYVNEFPPIKARELYKKYGGKNVLDPCAGWGGRMIAAASLGLNYTCCEPSTKTYNGLVELAKFLRTLNNDFVADINHCGFEDLETDKKFDISFTSPPYFNTELYSNEPTQSYIKYDNIDRWIADFYDLLIHKASKMTKVCIFNVGSRKYDLKTPLLKNGFYRIDKTLSGGGGLGRVNDGKEEFFIKRSD